jgi:hypothetical protein
MLCIVVQKEDKRMFNKISDFVSEWKKETSASQRLMDTLTDESLKQAITPDHRTLGQIAWHLVWVIGSMSQMGLVFEKPGWRRTGTLFRAQNSV